MRLHNVKLQGFRRFETEESLNVSSKLTAIVGPNEAGKTSLLRAIGYFSDGRRIVDSDKTSLSDVDVRLTLSFFLDDEDLKAAGLATPSWLDLVKEQDGELRYRVHPNPPRDTTKRQELAKQIRKLTRRRAAVRLIMSNEDVSVIDLDEIVEILVSPDPFSNQQIEALSYLEKLTESSSPVAEDEAIRVIVHDLKALLKFERSHDPHQRAIGALSERCPSILNFTPDYRNIVLPYNLSLYNHEDRAARQSPSKPLAEIIRLSGLDLARLKKAIETGDDAVKIGLLAAANEKLVELSKLAWKQSDASLYLTTNNFELTVLVRNVKDFDIKDQFANFDARSDGYKQFVALQIFTFLKKSSGAILLIDEIEHHLHYDAQADLIQILQGEPSIGSVIYTTHSAGALPEDLGVGVRLVEWDKNRKKNSKIINKFWYRHDADGFKPLLFGMGAATLAFFPTRKALIGEGPTEMLLLPRLFREALGVERLDFQIVHGLANINPRGLPMIDGGGQGVCYVTDNDASGKTMRDALKDAGVPKNRIFSVSDVRGSLVTVEDLLDVNVWIDSVNRYIEMYGHGRGVTDLLNNAPAEGRIEALPDVIRKEKVAFAYNVIRILQDDPNRKILSSRFRSKVRGLGQKIRTALDL